MNQQRKLTEENFFLKLGAADCLLCGNNWTVLFNLARRGYNKTTPLQVQLREPLRLVWADSGWDKFGFGGHIAYMILAWTWLSRNLLTVTWIKTKKRIFPNSIFHEEIHTSPAAYSENPGGNRDGGSGFPILG